MFDDRMKTSAIPERVYALCVAVKSRPIQENDLREILEPSGLGGTTKYYGSVRDAARQLGLITVKEGEVSLAVESKHVASFEALRAYVIGNIGAISESLFYKVSIAYMALDEKIYKYKSVSEAELVAYMTKTTNVPVYEDDMRAWRFWSSFLGMGNLHDMLLLPNFHQYMKTVLDVAALKKGNEYTFTEFINIITPYAGIALSGLGSERKINMALSNGLRALHDEGVIQLSHKLDSGDMWFLYESELHAVKSTVTHVTVRR